MVSMIQLGVLVLSIIAIQLLTTTVMNFVGIGVQYYGIYLMWFIVLAIFYFILPQPTKFFEKTM
tara:strand:- start:4618 stop:4809 length:192 start_codon:yes stop_codon:yes gene_type:complete